MAEIQTPYVSEESIDRKQQRIKALRMERKQLNSENKSISVNLKILEQEYAESCSGTEKYPLKSLIDAIDRIKHQKDSIAKRLSLVKAELKKTELVHEHLLEQKTISRFSWGELFEAADMEIKRLVTSCLVKNVLVSRGYDINVEYSFIPDQIDSIRLK